MKTETEAQADARRKRRRKERIVPFSSVVSSASVELTSQTSKCEPVLTEAQAETEEWDNENALFQFLKTKFDWIRSKVKLQMFSVLDVWITIKYNVAKLHDTSV